MAVCEICKKLTHELYINFNGILSCKGCRDKDFEKVERKGVEKKIITVIKLQRGNNVEIHYDL
jgi:hypothetical protein